MEFRRDDFRGIGEIVVEQSPPDDNGTGSRQAGANAKSRAGRNGTGRLKLGTKALSRFAAKAQCERAAPVEEDSASEAPPKEDSPKEDPAEQAQREHARKWGIPFVDLRDHVFVEAVIKAVPAALLKEHKVIPLSIDGNVLSLAMTDPLNVRAIDEIHLVTGFSIKPMVAVEERVLEALDIYLGLAPTEVEGMVESASKEAEGREGERVEVTASDAEDLRISKDEPVIVRLVNLILAGAISNGASDIHIQPEEKHVRVRYRIDGVLQDAPVHSWRYGRAVVARFKVMARMDIAEKRRPQDGRISFTSDGRRYDLRVSTIPSVYGEKVVMRIAEHDSWHVGLHELGYSEDQLKRFEAAIARPYGMVLVTGPTGSGKTTTLYSALSRLNLPEKNIITVEDPVERRLTGVTQIQVGSSQKSPLTFARALRSVLRQDPDIVMVGEIRDHETALIATEASLTGHLVLSTLHTNDAPGSPPRLIEMGIPPFLVSSSLLAVVAQRLVRVLCPACKEAYSLPTQSLAGLNLPHGYITTRKITAYKPRGCASCHDHGYKGRIGVFELLVVTDEMRRLILEQPPAVEIAKLARSQGMSTMLEDVISKVLRGITSLEEAVRVVDTQ